MEGRGGRQEQGFLLCGVYEGFPEYRTHTLSSRARPEEEGGKLLLPRRSSFLAEKGQNTGAVLRSQSLSHQALSNRMWARLGRESAHLRIQWGHCVLEVKGT